MKEGGRLLHRGLLYSSLPGITFDDKRKSSETLASFSCEAGEASCPELLGVTEKSFPLLLGAFPFVIVRTLLAGAFVDRKTWRKQRLQSAKT